MLSSRSPIHSPVAHVSRADNRVVSCLDSKTIGGYEFESYGAHFDRFPTPYLTFACAIGMTKQEIDQLVKKLRKTIAEWKAKHGPAAATVHTKED